MLLPHRKIMCSNIFMASKHFFLKSIPFPTTLLLTSRTYSILFFSALPPNPTSNLSPFPLKSSGFSFTPHAIIPSSVELEDPEVETHSSERLRLLNEKLKTLGIDSGHCNPGQYYGLSCSMCKGGDSGEKTLSLFITKDGDASLWTCFRAKCGWRGSTQGSANAKSSYVRMSKITKVKEIRQITEQGLELQPLCSEICAHFAERMISGEALRRNFVMQRTYGDQVH